MVDIKMNQIELRRKKMTLSEMEILLDGINRKLDAIEERVSEILNGRQKGKEEREGESERERTEPE